MATALKETSDKLQQLKKSVEDAFEYNQKNIDRFNKFKKFTFITSLDSKDNAALNETEFPQIEFNILEAIVSRQRGEFAKQEPSLIVHAADGITSSAIDEQMVKTIEFLQGHMIAVFFDASNDMMQYNLFSDLFSGGFAVGKMCTDYLNAYSFEQRIYPEYVDCPTRCFFDPLAKESHKGDGQFCGEKLWMSEGAFEKEFGKDLLKKVRASGIDGVWYADVGGKRLIGVCDYYEKEFKKEELVLVALPDGMDKIDVPGVGMLKKSLLKKEYDKFVKRWNEAGILQVPPAIINKRKTTIEEIVRHRFCRTMMLDDSKSTDYKHLPYVFFDGNSVTLEENGYFCQYTKPYVYHAEGIQRMKNLAGQSLCNELENTIQHKIMAALESIPENYVEAYTNVQKAQTIVYNAFLPTENGPNLDVPLPPPREVARTPIPPQIADTFRMSDEMTQMILGTYDNASQVQSAPLSGIAFARGAIHSNNASMPWLVGYLKGMNRMAEIYIDMLPKYTKTPRTMPVRLPDGKREYVKINEKVMMDGIEDGIYTDYDPNAFEVKVEAGVNFAIQKEMAIQTVIALSNANPTFAEFFGEVGLPVLVDNIEIRGSEYLKEKSVEWLESRSKQQAAMAEQQQQHQQMQAMMIKKQLESPTAEQVGLISVQEKAKNDATSNAIKQQDSQMNAVKIISEVQGSGIDQALQQEKVDAENARTEVESAISLSAHLDDIEKGEEDAISKG